MDDKMIELLSRYTGGDGVQPGMFFGKLKKEVVTLKWKKRWVFWVKDAVSTDKTNESIKVLDKEALKSAEKYLDSYVCGVFKNEEGEQKLFLDTKQEAPVQIIPWEYINESNTQDGNRHLSLLDYFSRSCGSTGTNQTIRCTVVPLLGTRENPGHIIIYDTLEEGEVFLKGFLSVGGDEGLIQYSNRNIRIWGRRNDLLEQDSSNADSLDADFIDVVNYNQSALMRWRDKCFLLVVPKSYNNLYKQEQKHSVLDYSADSSKCEWLPLPFGNDKESISTEEAFLKRFIEFVKKCGYEYDPRDLIRFHTCAKCGFFTLLGGEPGTGKSSLALLYAKAIAGRKYEDKQQLLRVDVNPGWMEPADLMGFYSPNKDKFIESEVGLVSFLRDAQNVEEPRMVCFEEMNLAYVEHYFSDFIQQMSRANGDRKITIKKGNAENSKTGCEDIQLKDNLRFFGTINFDETTKELSARFYDRCNYIELSPTGKAFPRLRSPVKNDILCEGDEISLKVFNEWVDNAWEGKIDGWIMDRLNEVYPILQSLHIAPNWRKARDIYRYIVSRPQLCAGKSKDNDAEVGLQKYTENEIGDFNRKVLDEVMVQSVLPVYRRPNEIQESAQKELHKFLKEYELKLSSEMFARILRIETPYQDET
ncbi:MAG: AAA family ATPase [Kiritimatiellae bacterium]|nr:AAA family ATPase [Kiritimatiellia bacterium]